MDEKDTSLIADDGMTGGDDQSLEISSDLIRGHINTIILRCLYDGDKYGYDIIYEIERKIPHHLLYQFLSMGAKCECKTLCKHWHFKSQIPRNQQKKKIDIQNFYLI